MIEQIIEYISKTHDTKTLSVMQIGACHGEIINRLIRGFKYVTVVDHFKGLHDSRPAKMKDFLDGLDFKTSTTVVLEDPQKPHFYHTIRDKQVDIVFLNMHDRFEDVMKDIEIYANLSGVKYLAGGLLDKPGVFDAVHEMFSRPDAIFKNFWIVKI